MHYYPFHVGDYIHDTAHLSNDEDLAFRRLLDLYYTQEKPIPNKTQEVARRIRMSKQELAVQTVLEEFFDFDCINDCWKHKRCDETIAAYQAKAERNRAIGKLGGRPKANPDKTQMVSKENPNQEPITINQEPKIKAPIVAKPLDVSDVVWDEFIQHRKAKKARVTQTVVDSIVSQAQKAGWPIEDAIKEIVIRNWQTFKADWVSNTQFAFQKPTFAQQAADIARVTVPGSNEPDPALLKIAEDRKKAVPIPDHIKAQINSVLRKA